MDLATVIDVSNVHAASKLTQPTTYFDPEDGGNICLRNVSNSEKIPKAESTLIVNHRESIKSMSYMQCFRL
jgi:hypothetical protein